MPHFCFVGHLLAPSQTEAQYHWSAANSDSPDPWAMQTRIDWLCSWVRPGPLLSFWSLAKAAWSTNSNLNFVIWLLEFSNKTTFHYLLTTTPTSYFHFSIVLFFRCTFFLCQDACLWPTATRKVLNESHSYYSNFHFRRLANYVHLYLCFQHLFHLILELGFWRRWFDLCRFDIFKLKQCCCCFCAMPHLSCWRWSFLSLRCILEYSGNCQGLSCLNHQVIELFENLNFGPSNRRWRRALCCLMSFWYRLISCFGLVKWPLPSLRSVSRYSGYWMMLLCWRWSHDGDLEWVFVIQGSLVTFILVPPYALMMWFCYFELFQSLSSEILNCFFHHFSYVIDFITVIINIMIIIASSCFL